MQHKSVRDWKQLCAGTPAAASEGTMMMENVGEMTVAVMHVRLSIYVLTNFSLFPRVVSFRTI